MKISRRIAVDLIRETGGKFFSATVTSRKTGEPYEINCRTGVHKGITGKGGTYVPQDKNLITVYRVGKGWRSIAIEGIQSVRIGGTKFEVRD